MALAQHLYLRMLFSKTLEQANVHPPLTSCLVLNQRWQLEVVSNQDEGICQMQRSQADHLQAHINNYLQWRWTGHLTDLGGLVNDTNVKSSLAKQLMRHPKTSGRHNLGLKVNPLDGLHGRTIW